MKFIISGSSGLVGTELRHALRAAGHEVTRLVRAASTRSEPGEREAVWNPASGTIDAAALEGHDVAINLAGENLLGIWTKAKKQRIRESRLGTTRLLVRSLTTLGSPPRTLLSGSAMGYYGVCPPDQPLDESAPQGSGFLAELVGAWEAETAPAAEAGIRVVLLRSANVLSPRGGLLGAMLPVFKLGLGGTLGRGDRAWSWVAIEELGPLVLHLANHQEIAGPVNVAAPNAVTNLEFTEILARVLHRPALLFVPQFALRLAPGGMGEDTLLASQRLVPGRLLDSDFAFRWPDLEQALRDMLG